MTSPPPAAPIAPRERRRHQVFLTRGVEYHLRDGRCVAVRDRGTGRFIGAHAALGCAGRLQRTGVGDQLRFVGAAPDVQLVSGAVQRVERAPRELVGLYPRALEPLGAAGLASA